MNMKPHYALPTALVAGLAIGAILTTALRAQNTPPAYVVAEVAIHDAEAFAKDYAPKVTIIWKTRVVGTIHLPINSLCQFDRKHRNRRCSSRKAFRDSSPSCGNSGRTRWTTVGQGDRYEYE